MRPPPDNAVLQALMEDMRDFGQGRQCKLLPRLMEDRGKSALLALDAFNLLSLELIQNQECYAQDPPILESVFLKRRQLCIDLQTSALRNSASLAAVLGTYEVEALPAEFPVALLWDEGPIASSICDVLLKLTGEVMVTLPEETCRLRLISLTLSKGTLAVSVTPGQGGRVNLSAEDTTLEMKPEELVIFASLWEIKPELAFFSKAGASILPTFSSSTIASIEAQVRDTETVALEAPVPSIVMSGEEQGDAQDYDGQDGWQCAQCGEINEKHRGLCGKCGMPALDAGETPKDSAPEPLQDLRGPTKRPTWKCRYCFFENSEGNTCGQCRKTNTTTSEAPEVGKKGWTCEYCTLVNSEYDRICNACAKTRKDLLPPSPEEPDVPAFWKCEECGCRTNASTDTRCSKCRAPKGKQETRKDKDDWVCPNCQKENYSFSRACRTCKSPKPEEDLHRPGSRTSDTEPDQRQEIRIEPQANPKGAKAADTWRCEKCGVEVQGSRSYCNSCYARKPTPGNRDQETPKVSTQEDWKCGNCQHVNRPTREVCLICRVPRAKVERVKEAESDWTCKQCGQQNPDKEALCLSCYERKPSELPKAAAQYDTWTCGKCRASNNYYDSSCKKCGVAKTEVAAKDDGRVERQRKQSNRLLDPSAELRDDLDFPADRAGPSTALRVDYAAREGNPRAEVPRPPRNLDIDLKGEGRLGAPTRAFEVDIRDDPRPIGKGDPAIRGAAANPRQEARVLMKGEAAERALDVRGEARPQADVKSSYWNCSACTAMNLAMDKDCYRCHQPKSASVLEPAPAEPKPRNTNYWMCESCGAQNFKDDVKCFRCKQAKDGERQEPSTEATWACAYCQAKNGEKAEYCSKCFKDRQKQTAERPTADRARQEGWLCKFCSEENTSSSDRCTYCFRNSARKGTVEQESRTKTCSSCGQPTTKDSQLCPMCEREVKYRSPKAWTCPKCRVSVSGNYCSRCYASKPRS